MEDIKSRQLALGKLAADYAKKRFLEPTITATEKRALHISSSPRYAPTGLLGGSEADRRSHQQEGKKQEGKKKEASLDLRRFLAQGARLERIFT